MQWNDIISISGWIKTTLLHIYQSDVNINNLVLLYKNISTPIKQLRNCKFAVCIAYSTYVSYAYAKEKKPTC
jgi:hypothetical protein